MVGLIETIIYQINAPKNNHSYFNIDISVTGVVAMC